VSCPTIPEIPIGCKSGLSLYDAPIGCVSYYFNEQLQNLMDINNSNVDSAKNDYLKRSLSEDTYSTESI
jgi:hypothetical protein